MNTFYPFHLAIRVHSLPSAINFYSKILGLQKCREAENWVDYNFFGHQLSIHQVSDLNLKSTSQSNVDSKSVPIPHFGVLLDILEYKKLVKNLTTKNVSFLIDPNIRFEGKEEEQHTFFIQDPSNNTIEIKGVKDYSLLF